MHMLCIYAIYTAGKQTRENKKQVLWHLVQLVQRQIYWLPELMLCQNLANPFVYGNIQNQKQIFTPPII